MKRKIVNRSNGTPFFSWTTTACGNASEIQTARMDFVSHELFLWKKLGGLGVYLPNNFRVVVTEIKPTPWPPTTREE